MAMHHYTYKIMATKVVVFECDAASILDADAKFLAATAIVAEKASHIGCSIS